MTDEPLFDPSVESIPEEIRALLLKEDGTLKRIILYGLSAADIVNNGKAGLDSIIAQLEEMVKGADVLVFVFVPAALRLFMHKCKLEMHKDYLEMLDKIGEMEKEAFLSELDKDSVWKNVSDKANSNIDISSEEMMQLIIYPLAFKSWDDKQDAIRRVIELVKQLQDERKKIFILKCLMAFSDKIIREEDARQIKEVLMMTKVERLIYEDAEAEVSNRIARNLVRDGNSVESVAKNTGLSKEIVIRLAEEIAKEKSSNNNEAR